MTTQQTKFKINQQIAKEIEKLAGEKNITLKEAAGELFHKLSEDNLLTSMGQVSAYIEALDNKEKKAASKQVVAT